jgi:hypothetical protein
MPVKSLLAICLPTYNALHHLKAFLESVRREVKAAGRFVPVVISDDCSTDGSADYLDAFAADLPWLTVVHQARNLGGWGNVEYFVLNPPDSVYLWMLSQDDRIEPGALPHILDQLESRSPSFMFLPHTFVEANGRTRESPCPLEVREFTGSAGLFRQYHHWSSFTSSMIFRTEDLLPQHAQGPHDLPYITHVWWLRAARQGKCLALNRRSVLGGLDVTWKAHLSENCTIARVNIHEAGLVPIISDDHFGAILDATFDNGMLDMWEQMDLSLLEKTVSRYPSRLLSEKLARLEGRSRPKISTVCVVDISSEAIAAAIRSALAEYLLIPLGDDHPQPQALADAARLLDRQEGVGLAEVEGALLIRRRLADLAGPFLGRSAEAIRAWLPARARELGWASETIALALPHEGVNSPSSNRKALFVVESIDRKQPAAEVVFGMAAALRESGWCIAMAGPETSEPSLLLAVDLPYLPVDPRQHAELRRLRRIAVWGDYDLVIQVGDPAGWALGCMADLDIPGTRCLLVPGPTADRHGYARLLEVGKRATEILCSESDIEMRRNLDELELDYLAFRPFRPAAAPGDFRRRFGLGERPYVLLADSFINRAEMDEALIGLLAGAPDATVLLAGTSCSPLGSHEYGRLVCPRAQDDPRMVVLAGLSPGDFAAAVQGAAGIVGWTDDWTFRAACDLAENLGTPVSDLPAGGPELKWRSAASFAEIVVRLMEQPFSGSSPPARLALPDAKGFNMLLIEEALLDSALVAYLDGFSPEDDVALFTYASEAAVSASLERLGADVDAIPDVVVLGGDLPTLLPMLFSFDALVGGRKAQRWANWAGIRHVDTSELAALGCLSGSRKQ